MNIRTILTGCFAAATISVMAQTHAEGVEYYKADQFNNAKELLLRNRDKAGTDKAVTDYYLGLIALREGNTAEASKYFNQGKNENPDYGFNYIGLGQIELKNGNVKVAEQLFKEGEGKAKKDPTMQIAIARAYYNVDPTLYANQIEKRIEKARKTDISNPAVYIFEGDRLADAKDWGGAAAKYEMGANYDNSATEAYVKYAELFTMVNPEYAIRMLSKLLELNPTSALGQRELANAYYNNKDYSNAAKKYGEYVRNPNHFKQDEDRYAFLLFYGGDYQQGYDYATKLLAANPSNFTAQRYQFMNAAQLPAMKDQLLPLAEDLYKAHLSNKANKFAAIDYTLVADEFKNAKRIDEAVAVLQEGIAEMPDNANLNKQLAMTFVDNNQIGAASDAYAGYIAKLENPNFNDYIQQATFAYYGAIENEKENPTKAEEYFATTLKNASLAAEKLPDNYKPKKIEGDVAKQKAAEGDIATAAAPFYEEAIVMLEVSADPSRYASDAKEMYNYMGNYWLDRKDTAKAKEYFNKYLQYDPNNEAYRKFVDSLK